MNRKVSRKIENEKINSKEHKMKPTAQNEYVEPRLVQNERESKLLTTFSQIMKNLFFDTDVKSDCNQKPYKINWTALSSLATALMLFVTAWALAISYQANETSKKALDESNKRNTIEKITYSMNPSLLISSNYGYYSDSKHRDIFKYNFIINNFGDSVANDIRIYGAGVCISK